MSKIVIDARDIRTTTGRYVERLLYYLQQIDNKNDYLVLLKPEDFDSWQPSNSQFQKVANPFKEFTFGEQIGFLKLLKNLKPDLVHFARVQQPIFYHGKTVTTMQDLTTARFGNPSKNWLIFTIKQQVYKFVNWRVAHKSDWVITPSNFVKKDVQKFAHLKRNTICAIYDAADHIPDPPEPLELLTQKDFIMYVGRPNPHKNLKRLIEAFAILRQDHPNLVLAIVGKNDAVYEGIKKFTLKLGVEGVLFTDFVSEGQLRWLYENTQAYIFPSLSEGFGLPGLEAMVHGAPVVSSNATCLPEIYGSAAEYFDPLDVTSMTTAIKRVLINKKRRNELIKLGKKRAATYSWHKMAVETLAIYKSVLKEN